MGCAVVRPRLLVQRALVANTGIAGEEAEDRVKLFGALKMRLGLGRFYANL